MHCKACLSTTQPRKLKENVYIVPSATEKGKRMNEIKINMDNLSEDERNQLMKLIEKTNEPKSRVWRPECGECYYYINACGAVCASRWTEVGLDNECYDIGNVFRTKEEAAEEVKRRKILAKWKRLSIESGEASNEWNKKNEHWFVFFLYNKIEVTFGIAIKSEATYFQTKESILNAIEDIGEENVKKYILGIKE